MTLKNDLFGVVISKPVPLRGYSRALRYTGTKTMFRTKLTPLSITVLCFMALELGSSFSTTIPRKALR